LITGALAGVAVLSVAACNKPAPAGGGSAQASGAPASGAPASGAQATAAPAAGPISIDSLPHRRAGLWRQTMTMEGVQQALPETRLCTDAASEAKMSLMGQQMNREHCQTAQFTRNLDGSISYSSTCDFGAGGKTTSSGTLSGDFNSSFKVVINSSRSGGAAAGDHRMTITSTWLGPCQPGQKPGDVIMPDGRTINTLAAGQ
jgi:Protein of unknown function (DUF3617)